MYKLYFYVPHTHVEQVKQALFNAGAGKIGDYDCCAWQTLGQGQFRPLENSQPFVGEQNTLESVKEYKVELVCEDHLIENIVAALKQAHPYETPAFGAWRLDYS